MKLKGKKRTTKATQTIRGIIYGLRPREGRWFISEMMTKIDLGIPLTNEEQLLMRLIAHTSLCKTRRCPEIQFNARRRY